MNSRGQAFSVFQLLIAAIVAVAILAVLFSILPKDVIINAAPKNAIGNAISTVGIGGQTDTAEFDMAPGMIVTSNDFFEKGFDSQQIIFGVGDFEDRGVSVEIRDEVSYIKYDGAVTIQGAKASVFCQATGSSLKETLDVVGTDDMGLEEGLCLEDDTIQPCCVVVFRR